MAAPIQWSDESVKCLLDYMGRTNMLAKLESCKRNGPFYTKIVQHLERFGHSKTQAQVCAKLKNLKRDYNDAKNRERTAGGGPQAGTGKTIDRFMKEMELVMSGRFNPKQEEQDDESQQEDVEPTPSAEELTVETFEEVNGDSCAPAHMFASGSDNSICAITYSSDENDEAEINTSNHKGWVLDSNEGQFIVSEVIPPFDLKTEHTKQHTKVNVTAPSENRPAAPVNKRRRVEDAGAIAELIENQKKFFQSLHDRECKHMEELFRQQNATEERLSKEQREHEKAIIGSLIKAQERQNERMIKSQQEHEAAIIKQMQTSQQQHENLLLRIASKLLNTSNGHREADAGIPTANDSFEVS